MPSRARESWDRRIARAELLAARGDATAGLLRFYATLLAAQRDVHDSLKRLSRWVPSGSLLRDLDVIRPAVRPLLRVVAGSGPESLALDANRLLAAGDDALDEALRSWWRAPSDEQFFPKAVAQPYAQRLAELAIAPADRGLENGPNRCPFCAGVPQLSVFQAGAGDPTDTGSRALLCATCLGVWAFRRVRCARCGEQDERKLAYFHAPELEHLRVDACDTCGAYLKTVDMTRLGLAVPIVDEVAGAPLDVWAREQGYRKIELNLVGL
jgi:FdhE protein